MESFLRKIKLIDDMTTELSISKSEFIARLSALVEESSLGLFSDLGDVFSSNRAEYKGRVDYNGFKLKRKRRFFDTKINIAIVTGTYRQVADKLVIDSKIVGFKGVMIFFFLFILLFYLLFIGTFLSNGIDSNMPTFVLPFMLVHALFMFGIPYFIMRRSVKRFKYDLEREYHYIAAKPLNYTSI
nr:hypothetical protein [uncultured Psychroserpens sp.]